MAQPIIVGLWGGKYFWHCEVCGSMPVRGWMLLRSAWAEGRGHAHENGCRKAV